MTSPLASAGIPAYEIVAASSVLVVGAWVQGSVGFGMALLSAPLLLLIDPLFVPGPVIACTILINVAIFAHEREPIRKTLIGWGVLGAFVGSLLAVAVLAQLPVKAFNIVFSALVLVAVLLSARGVLVPPQRSTMIIAGSLSGFLGTITSIGGPPMALAFQRSSGPELRSSLSLFFIATATLVIFNLFLVGKFGWSDLFIAMLFVPAIAIGFTASRFTRGHFDRRGARPVILGLSTIAAVACLVRTFLT